MDESVKGTDQGEAEGGAAPIGDHPLAGPPPQVGAGSWNAAPPRATTSPSSTPPSPATSSSASGRWIATEPAPPPFPAPAQGTTARPAAASPLGGRPQQPLPPGAPGSYPGHPGAPSAGGDLRAHDAAPGYSPQYSAPAPYPVMPPPVAYPYAVATAPPPQNSGLSTAALICGIISFFFFAPIFGTAGIIMGAVAMGRGEPRGKTALIVSVIGLVLGLMVMFAILGSVNSSGY